MWRNFDHARIAVSGVDAVHGAALVERLLEKQRAACDALAEGRVAAQTYRAPPGGDLEHPFDGEPRVTERQGRHLSRAA
jgi:hypothetical protein